MISSYHLRKLQNIKSTGTKIIKNIFLVENVVIYYLCFNSYLKKKKKFIHDIATVEYPAMATVSNQRLAKEPITGFQLPGHGIANKGVR